MMMNALRKYLEINKDGSVQPSGPQHTSPHVMSLIEDSSLLPLFSNDFPDLSASGLVPDSPSKFAFLKKASGGFLANSQAITEEPLFSLFLSGGIAGLDESLLAGIVPDASVPKMDPIPRQYMSIVPDAQVLDVVPQVQVVSTTQPPIVIANKAGTAARRGSDANSRKRKFIQAPNMKTEGGIVEGNQPLTPEEERNMKRQRRLVKNREAAQLFRQRQKAYIQDLEKKVQDLTATNNEFRARVELLNSENKLIKEQLLYLRNFVTQAVSFSFPGKTGVPNAPPGMPSVGGIPAGIASLALGNLAASPNLQGSMASMLSAVTGPLPASLLSGLPMGPVMAGSTPSLVSSPSSSLHPPTGPNPVPSTSLPSVPSIPSAPSVSSIPSVPSSISNLPTNINILPPAPQHVSQRPLSPVLTIDPTLSPQRSPQQLSAPSAASVVAAAGAGKK